MIRPTVYNSVDPASLQKGAASLIETADCPNDPNLKCLFQNRVGVFD
jgi:hypothetical protein